MAQTGRMPVFLDNADPAAVEQIKAIAAANGLQLDFMSGPAPTGGQPLPLRPHQISPPQQVQSGFQPDATFMESLKSLAQNCEHREQALKLKSGMPRPKVTGQSIQKRLANKSTPGRAGVNSMEPFLLDHPYPPCSKLYMSLSR